MNYRQFSLVLDCCTGNLLDCKKINCRFDKKFDNAPKIFKSNNAEMISLKPSKPVRVEKLSDYRPLVALLFVI